MSLFVNQGTKTAKLTCYHRPGCEFGGICLASDLIMFLACFLYSSVLALFTLKAFLFLSMCMSLNGF